MYKQKNNKLNKNKGITLIALVLTIIVLLVLAGVVISLALGQNGLLFKAKLSKQAQTIAQEKDKIVTAYGASFVNEDGKYDKKRFKRHLIDSGVEFDDDKLNTITESPLKIELIIKHDGYTVTYSIEDGIVNHKVGDDTTTNNTIPKDLKVGDTIIYDPTKGVTDQSKLTYTSYKGTAKTGGNGYDRQTITAKSNQNEWIVISTANNQVKVMAKNPIGDIEGGANNKFTLIGGIGWLYAEEELHKMCSVYGYGKGAKQVVTTYQIGNYHVPGEAQTRTLIGSGARSMTMEDIVKIMKGEAYTDFTDAEKKLFYKTDFKSREEKYPTISVDNEYGISKDIKRFDNEFYLITSNSGYSEELVTDIDVEENKTKLKNYIFKDNIYFLASTCIFVMSNMNDPVFKVRYVRSSSVGGGTLVSHSPLVSFIKSDQFLRPVVYLDGSMLEKQSNGVWEIK